MVSKWLWNPKDLVFRFLDQFGVSWVNVLIPQHLSVIYNNNNYVFTHSWFIPFVGHMGICTSAGVIRDFAAPYYVSVSILTCVYDSYSMNI